MKVQPYLYFDGRCEEALDYYKTTLDAKVHHLMRFADNPEPQMTPSEGCAGGPVQLDKVMHAMFTVGESTLMASDGMAAGKPEFKGFSLTLELPDEAEVKRLAAVLSDGGHVQMPVTRTFFSPAFCMLTDRFGVSWTLLAAAT